MENMEMKLQRYRESIPTREITEAFKTYYETKDKIIRQNLIFRYMPQAKDFAINYGVTTIEPEDLEQIAYETLIKCIDSYNPHTKRAFCNYLMYSINKSIKDYNDEIEKISLTDVELYSSENFEENLINKIGDEELKKIISELLDSYPNQNHAEIFKKLCITECNTITHFCKKEKVSKTLISQAKKSISAYIYLNLPKELQYYPSKIIEKLITDPSLWFLCITSKSIKNGLKNINLKELEYMPFYDPNVNTIYGDINISKEKTKKLEYK